MTTDSRASARTGRKPGKRPAPFGALLAVLLLAFAVLASGPAQAAADPNRAGLLFKSPQDDRLIVPSALSTAVEIRANGLVQRVRVLQKFRNDTAAWLEGVYVFPLPEGAAVDRLRLHVGARTIEGEIRERAEAKAEYEAAKTAGQRASLVEQERPNIFTTSVANVGPGDEIAVEIEYQDRVPVPDGGRSPLRGRRLRPGAHRQHRPGRAGADHGRGCRAHHSAGAAAGGRADQSGESDGAARAGLAD
jgi:hypothetical protein